MSLAQRVVCIASSEVGVKEVPKRSNSGCGVDDYLKSVGLKPGYAWCMAFVYWVVNRAAKELDIKNPLVRTAGVLRQWNETTLRKLPKTSRAIKPGDIFIMDFGKGLGHTGIVESVTGGVIQTIEGNTNDNGSREGDRVARRSRPISSIKGFIQLPT